jgi:DNA-binding response OmpR family regulator
MILSVLLVEDELELRKYVQDLLVEQGYAVYTADRGTDALEIIAKIQPNLIILDLGLPDVTGESLCRTIRENYPDISIVILTGKSTTENVVEGLTLGADDYIVKPFDGAELMARVNAHLRRHRPQDSEYTADDLVLNNKTMEVARDGKSITLTAQEFRLLEYLLINKGKVLSRDMILNRLWRASPDVETRVVDVYIGYLRKKIDKGHLHKLIHSVRGFGYVIKDTNQ